MKTQPMTNDKKKNRKNTRFGVHLIFVYNRISGDIAQLVEHLPYKQTVGGSSPSIPKNQFYDKIGLSLF